MHDIMPILIIIIIIMILIGIVIMILLTSGIIISYNENNESL